MGPTRTLDRVGNELGKSMSLLTRWSHTHKWVDRCIAWDNHLQETRNKVLVAQAAKWERRRLQALENNWDASQRLREKLDQMLKWPIQRQETSRDGKAITIHPAKWTFMTTAIIARAAAEIEQACIDAATKPIEQYTDEELEAIENANHGVENPGPDRT